MQATPPEITENRGVAADATAPASTSPNRGPLATTRLKTEDILPRRLSGVRVCEMVLRHTALTLSAAPATAKRVAAGTIGLTAPAAAIARQLTASVVYAAPSPSCEISTPPSAGPTTIATWYMPNVNESAARSWSGRTTFGTIEARVTRSTAELPAAAPAST